MYNLLRDIIVYVHFLKRSFGTLYRFTHSRADAFTRLVVSASLITRRPQSQSGPVLEGQIQFDTPLQRAEVNVVIHRFYIVSRTLFKSEEILSNSVVPHSFKLVQILISKTMNLKVFEVGK